MLQLSETSLLWRRKKRRVCLEDFCCNYICSSLIIIGCITLLPQGTTQHNDDVYIVKPTPAFRFGKEELTTVLLVDNENQGRYTNVRPEVGLLTSTARTFIQEGVTTEYATQVVGTTLDNGRVYAQYLKKSSRVLYDSGIPVPSVVTSWVGESMNSDLGFLPQSHNDLFDADKPDWQAIDDRLLGDHRRQNDFVGNTDYVNVGRKPLLPSILKGSEESTLKTSLSSGYNRNTKPAFNFVGQPRVLEENALKVAANKVLPIADLPTYTIKQNYEPSAYLLSDDGAKLKEDIDSSEAFSRNPKLIYKKMMQSSLKSKNESNSFTSLRHNNSARQFATVTYYGFAEFTTVVGDSVIVFSPSTSTSHMNYNAHVTSIKGEATLGTGLPQGPSISKVPITIAQDIIEPTITQQSTVKVLLEKPVTTTEAKADEKEPSFSFTSTKTVKNESMDTEESISILETSEIVVQPSEDKISSAHSTTIVPSVMLSRPSNEEILRIYNSLANAGKSKMQSSSADKATNLSSALTYAEKVHSETSNVQIFGGATTIFFEDDPFANFVVPSKTSINPGSTTASHYNSNVLSDDIISTESSYLSKDTKTELLESISSTEAFAGHDEIMETTTDEYLTTTEKYFEADVNNTIVTSYPDTDQHSEDDSNSEDILSVSIKEINPNNGNETLSDCISTSQVFLTQLPKTVTHFETVIAPDASVTSRLHTEVREQIHRTFEVKEATKYYCIQASTTQENHMENPLISPTVYATEKEGLDAAREHFDMAEATDRNSEEDETEIVISSTTEDSNNVDRTERTDLNESDNFSNSDAQEEEDEEASGQSVDDEEEEEIELIYKTLYTTYTYLTTFFLDDSTSISSHTDVVTNIMTSTLGRSSLKETSHTKLIANLNDNEINPTGTVNSIQMESTKRFVVPSELQNFIRTGEEIDPESESNLLSLSDNSILASKMLATLYTTYTYYTTIFADGETEIMSHTEIITNIKKPTASATSEDEKLILPTSSLQTMRNNETLSSTIILDKESVINYNPLLETEPNSKSHSVTTVISNVMASLPNIPDLGDLSAITIVTDVRSSSSPGDKQIINNFEAKSSNDKVSQQQSLFEDQISSESNIDRDEIMPSATLLLQTSFTTFTYYTTMYSGEETNVISRLETMTNTVTETLQPSTIIDLVGASAPTTYFTTFTYWTKLAREGQITTLSREETISNIITPTYIQQETSSQTDDLTIEKEVAIEKLSMTEASLTNEVTSKKGHTLNQPSMAEISIATSEVKYNTNMLEPTTYYTTYTYYTTSYETDKTITDSRFETVTNIITPTATLTNTGVYTEDLVTLESPIVSSSLNPVQDQSKTNQSKSDLVLYDFKKIIDADGISTIFFTTEIKQTANLDGSLTEVSSSSSSLLINEEKRSIHATAVKDSLTPILGPDGQVQKQYKTGLVRLIEGTRIANCTTTLYQSKVIGTVIDQRYAQIIESTSSFLFEKTKAPVDTINLNTPILPTSLSNSENIQATDQIRTFINGLPKVEGSIVDSSSEQEIETTTKLEVEADEENNSKTDERLRFPFQTKKSPVILPLKPFSNRNRPQFAPKKNSSATIITRSDFTPTITATPALKTISRYPSARRGSSSGVSSSNSALFATSSKRFGRPSKSLVAGTAILSSSLAGGTGYSGASRNRFASSSNARGSFASSSRRLGSSTATVRPSFSRPYLFSSSFSGNSRARVRPTTTRESEDVLTSVDIFTSAPLSSQEEGLTQDESDEVEENTTESNRRQNNPLLRLRRPLNRPQAFTPARLQPNSPNNAVSLRRNPLISRSRSGNTATLTTTTTTAKPKPRTFQSPIISQNRIRPTNSLFPPRNIFGVQKPAVTTEENRDLSEEDGNENNDDSEYEDEEDEESDSDDEEENSRRRRSNNKARQILKPKKRSKRESDNQNRSNFRNRFRRPKLTSPIQTELKSSEDDRNETKEIVTTSVPLVISSHKSRTRFGSRYSGHPSSSSTTSVAISPATSSNHKAIRPTRPSNSNNGRAQFTLREKDLSFTSTTQKGLTSVKRPAFRRPQPGGSVSSRRIPSSTAPSSSTSGKRRLKSFSNNDSTTTSRNPVTGRSRSSSTISGRSRSSSPSRDNNIGGRNRSRNKLNNEALILDNSGTIIVTHVVPAEVTIPIVNGKVTEYKQVVTAKTSTEILGPQQYTTTLAANGHSRLVLTREDSSVNYNGATEVTKYILHETPTTTITFTPTTIRGRKTSFSHVLPSTVYSVEPLVSTVQPQISANAPLANILLSQLLLGNVGIPAANPLLEALGGALTHPGAVGTTQPATPVTEYKTHASTYVTTLFEASQNLHKQFQHYIPGQDEPKSLDTLNASYDYSKIENTNDIINQTKDQIDDIDEARYNLATRVMSNGVEVIIASDKTKTPDHQVPDIYNTQLQYKKPMTLAASTIKNQMMILLFSSSLNTTQPSNQQLYNLPFYTNHFITKTCLTTYTYRTTYVQDGRTTVESREKVISNIATEERNYPKITPTQSKGVTLTKTPELAVGIFPTTYSYFNTYKDNTNKLQVMTSEYTVVNTITGPNDYVAYLQPTAKATPALETNTYYNEVKLSQKINSKIHTVTKNVTQVVVTKSFVPAYSTSVLTSYFAYDGESLEDSKANLNILTTLLTLNGEEKDEEKLNTDNMKKTEDIHIYATKTFLTTFTYYTTTVISSYSTDSSQTKLGSKHMSTVFNYYTRVIENVITDSVPSTLLPNELIAKMKIELSKQKPHQRHRVIVTTATLKNGQEIKISAMEMYKDNLASVSLTLIPPLKNAASQSKPEESLNHSQEKTEEYYHIEETDQLEESLNSSDYLPSLGNNNPESQEEQEENNGFASLPSEQILTIVDAPNNNPTNDNIPQVIYNKPPTSAANHLIQRLTALKPMFSAVADLLQNNFGVTRGTIKPVTSIESKQASNKKINSSSTNTTFDTKHPIYIPVPKIPIKNNLYEISNYTEFVSKGLHIKPPLLVNGKDSFEMNNKESALKDKHTNIIPFPTFTTPRQEQPLHNGGIYIRPGEIITANSDVIVGKPNGIEYIEVSNQQYVDKNTSKVYPSNNRFQVTYYHNKVLHSYKKKPYSSFASITQKPHHIPIVNNVKTSNKLKPQPTFGLRPLNEQHFNKNILKPPPLPQIIQSSIPIYSQQGLSLTLTAPEKPSRNRSKQRITTTTTTPFFSTEPASPLSPLLASTTHRTLEFPPSPAPPSRNSQTFYNFNNAYKNNEIYQKTQGLSTDLKSTSIKILNSSKLLNANPKSHKTKNIETSFEKKSNSLNWHNIRKPQTFETAMRLQPETNIVHQEKGDSFAQYFPKYTSSLNWDNGRDSQTKTSTSAFYIDEYKKQNFDVLDKSSEPETAYTESSIAWNFESIRQPQTNNQFYSHVNKVKPISFQKYKNSELISHQHAGFTNQEDTKALFKSLESTPITSFSQNLSSKSTENNEKPKNYSNKSVTKNHQNVSLDQHIFSHTVDVNVPPLTFNREDYDYPQQAAIAVRGQIPPATVNELYTQSENAYKLMPLITIPANKQQVHVSLTPTNLIKAITLPLEVSNDPTWNAMEAINDKNNNNILQKNSLPNDNSKIFLNNQDQKTLGTNNVLNINPKAEENSDWKHHRRQQQPMLVTSKPVNTALRQTYEKNPKPEQHLRSRLKSNRKKLQTKESIGSQILSNTTIQPLFPASTDLKRPPLSKSQPQIPLNELKIAITKPSRFIQNSSDCLEHNSENEPLGALKIQTTEKTSKPGTHGTRVSTRKTYQPENLSSTTVSLKISKTTIQPSIQKKSKSTAKDINKIINLKKTDDELMHASEVPAYGEPFKKPIFNNIEQIKEPVSIDNNQTRIATIFVSSGEAFKTSTNYHNPNFKITTVKPKLKLTKDNPSTQQSFLPQEISITQEAINMVPSNMDTKSSTLKTNTGLKPPPVTKLTHLNSTSKVVLPHYALLNKSKNSYEEISKRQPNRVTGENSSEEFITEDTTSDVNQSVTHPDENFNYHDVLTIKAVKYNEIAISQKNLSLAAKSIPKQNENEIATSNGSLKFFNLQPSESYEGKILTATTLPLAATTHTFTTTTTTTIKRIIMPTKFITNKRVYTVTAIPSVPDLLLSSPNNLNSNSVLYTTKTTTEVTTLFLTHTQINTIIDTVTSVKTLDPITITATSSPDPSATQTLLTKLTSIQPHMSELDNDYPFKYTVAHTLKEKQNITYLPYPSIEIVPTNITQESTINPNENSIFIIMTNNKNKKNTIFNHHSPSKNETILRELADDKNIGEIDETNEVMIEYDNGISFDDISIRDEEPTQIVSGKSVASSAFVNNEVSVTKSSSDDHVILGGVLIATPPKLQTKHLYSNKSTSISCHPKCKTSRNEQCGLVDNNWSCFCRPGFARTFPDRSCKPTYIYDLIMHADRVGNYVLQYVSELENNKTEHYRQLSQLVTNALDRMIMQSDFRDVYYGAEVIRYADSGGNHHGILINVLLQLFDNSNEKRLEEVLKKNLRSSNYSIGGTDLYTNKAGVDALSVKDFNECVSRRLHDCSENAQCFNLPGTYTCSCVMGFVDLSESPTYPGRICSSEQIGCEMCHYHGKCLTLVSNSNYQSYCECFPWYAGSKCKVNLKILLIVLLGIGTLLFILLLFCILITCTKRRNHLQHTTLAASTMTSSSEGLQKNSRLSTSLLFTSVGLRNSLRGVSLKNNKRQKPIKIDKRLMIKDSSSETSQNSLPYVLKNRDPITNSCNKQKSCLLKQSRKYRNCDSQGIKTEQYPIEIENQSDFNNVLATSSSLRRNNQQTEQQILLGNVTEYEGHYCEQSDRSLTVMIPRAKYHSSVLSQTQLMHHQLTMDRVHKVAKSEIKLINADKDPDEKRNHKNNLSTTTKEITDEENHTGMPSNTGALISAGFEVSAIVRDNSAVVNFGNQPNDLVHFGSITPNYNLITTSESATSLDSISDQKHHLNEEKPQYTSNKKFSSNESEYKCEKDLIETMDQWLGNVKFNELSAEARSFDETTIRASTKALHLSLDGTQTQLQDEVNTMTERDLGSTFLLPHTHLYKPERESELSGLDSF